MESPAPRGHPGVARSDLARSALKGFQAQGGRLKEGWKGHGARAYNGSYVLEDPMPNSMKHIHRDPGICNGRPVIKGTRVTLKTVL